MSKGYTTHAEILAGLSDEYRDYRIIFSNQLQFRPAATDEEKRTAEELKGAMRRDVKTMFMISAGIIIVGLLTAFSSLENLIGGIISVMFGLMPAAFGILKLKQINMVFGIATGVLLNMQHPGKSDYRFIIEVDGMEKTICMLHARPEYFDEVRAGDRILIIEVKYLDVAKKII